MAYEHFIENLIAFSPQDLPVISLYLNAQPDERGRHNFDVFARKQLTERAKTYPPHTEERKSFDEDALRISRYLEQEVAPPTQGIAIFACAGAADFFEAAQLEVPIANNEIFVLDRPHLYPLVGLLDQHQRYAVLLADTNTARIFVFGVGKALTVAQLQNVKTKRSHAGGWSQMRYQRHTENYHLHHAKEVIESLERVVLGEQIDHIVLAGDQETIIPLLRSQMPKELEEKVIDVLSLPVNTPEHEILESSLVAYRKHDAISDKEKVEHLLNEYRAVGLGVVGVPETLAALSNGQVEELLISHSVANLKYQEDEVEQVLAAYAAADSKSAKITTEPPTVANELVSRAQQISSAKITFIEDASLLEGVGGVGALLRYRF